MILIIFHRNDGGNMAVIERGVCSLEQVMTIAVGICYSI